jgi:hypothetical protein
MLTRVTKPFVFGGLDFFAELAPLRVVDHLAYFGKHFPSSSSSA